MSGQQRHRPVITVKPTCWKSDRFNCLTPKKRNDMYIMSIHKLILHTKANIQVQYNIYYTKKFIKASRVETSLRPASSVVHYNVTLAMT